MTGSRIVEHLTAVAPPDHLAVVALRSLTPKGRGLGNFTWMPPAWLADVPDWWACQQLVRDEWRWIHTDAGGIDHAVRYGHVHRWIPGVPMLRLVTATSRPEIAGRLDELAGALGVMVDLDVAECRPGDRRPYCPTIAEGLELLWDFRPSVIVDAGGGLAAVWLFDRIVEPRAARDLAADLIVDVGNVCGERGWAFDSPAFGGQWLKVPGCHDYFRGVDVAELSSGGPTWPFAALRARIPAYPRRPARAYPGELGRGR